MAQGETNTDELRLTLEKIKAQGKDNMSEYHKSLLKWTRNVDKRYAWVVLAALWFMMTAVLGPYRIYGLIFARVTSEGVYTREEASWPVSMIFTVENVVGPFVSIIVYYTTYRQSMLIGGLLLALGNGLAALSSSLIIDVILLGFVQGIGYAFIFMPFMGIINSYFIKYRNIALGFALCGGTLSVFGWSPLFQWMLDTYPWRYSYIGISLVCCIILIMVPLLKPNPRPQLKRPSNEKSPNERNNLARLSIRALTYQNSVRKQSTILIYHKTAQNAGVQRHASIISVNPFASSAGLERKISHAITTDMNQVKTPITNQASVMPKTTEQYESTSLSEVGQDSEFEMSIIWDVLKTPGFHLIWYNELVYFWVFSIYCLVMVDYGMDRGCTKDEAELLLNFQSIGELFGRLVLTIFVDMRFMSNKNMVILVLLIMAGLLVLVTQVTGFIWMAGITVATSSFSSLLYILLNGLLVDYLGERQVTIGYGMASCIGGILMSFRPQAVGYFRDNMGTYDPLMICLAISCAIGAFLWIIEPIITKTISKTANINGVDCTNYQDSSA